jgi:hypothetical protein
MPRYPEDFNKMVFQIFASEISPMIVLTPTDRYWTKETTEIFLQRKSILVPLRDLIEVGSNSWTATEAWRETLQNFLEKINPPNRVEVPRYEFRKKGEMWVVRYNGESIYLKDSIGLQCIAQLLAKPYDPLFVTELRAIVSGQKQEIISQHKIHDEVADRETLRNIKRRYLELQTDLEEAQRDENALLKQEIEQEMERIVQYFSQVRTKGGETRQMSNDFEKARSATSKAFWRTLDLIRDELPQFATHLEKSCIVGVICNYNPEHKFNWVL